MPNRRRQQQARAPSGQQPTGGLQLETVVAAQSIFEEDVMRPALEAPEGLARLEAVCAAYLSYVERQVFPGGCFFASVLAEMDARSGPIHDLVRSGQRAWMDGLAELARQAQRHGELADDADVEQLAFELQACLELANYHSVLSGTHRSSNGAAAGVRNPAAARPAAS